MLVQVTCASTYSKLHVKRSPYALLEHWEVWVLRARAASAALADDATAGGNATAPRKPMVLKQGVLCTKNVLASLSQPLWDCVDRIFLEHVKDDFAGQN